MKRKIKNSLATKFAASFTALFVLIMLMVAFAVRQTIIDQFTFQYNRGVASTMHAMQQDLSRRQIAIGNQLGELAEKLREDYDFRLYAILLKEYQQNYILDYAQNYMPTMNLHALEITDHNGVVLSSGHYRNAFGRAAGGLIHRLRALEAPPVLVWFQRPNEKFLCLAVLDSTQLGGRKFYLIGGIEITSPFLRQFQHDTTEILVLQLPEKVFSSSPQWEKPNRLAALNSTTKEKALLATLNEEYSIGGFMLPVISGNGAEEASFFLLHPKTELAQILYGINERIFIISGIGIIIAIALSIWWTWAVAKPLQRLAKSAGDLSLEKLNVDFDVDSNDEVGVLNDALRRMVRRLRQSRIELALAEQKTALVEIARQVNHDIKNGFIPIHYVMQHWMEVAETEGDKLLQVFNERKMTVLKSLDYLENLARNYSRLRPNVTLTEVQVNPLIRDLLKIYQEVSPARIEFQMQLDDGNPVVQADPVQLRRAFENILRNSIDAIGEEGMITVSTEVKEDRIYVTWVDSGGGIPENIREKIFFNYVTTKPQGTGLGLINVKHIVEDFGGSVSLQSHAGHGTTVRLIFPLPNGVAN